MKHKDYMNNLKRDATYTICLEKVKIVYPKANIKWLKKNIKNMRTAFRKELKKIQDSKGTRLGRNSIYEPTLWYFDLLMFTIGC